MSCAVFKSDVGLDGLRHPVFWSTVGTGLCGRLRGIAERLVWGRGLSRFPEQQIQSLGP